MCGIVAVLRRPERPRRARAEAARGRARRSRGLAASVRDARPTQPGSARSRSASPRSSAALRGTAERSRCSPIRSRSSALEHRAASLTNVVVDLDAALDAYDSGIEIEALNAAVVRVKDALWALSRDRLRTARAVEHLGSGAREPRAIEAFHSVQVALSALDRLEVRGRDSAGLHILVTRPRSRSRRPDDRAPHRDASRRSALHVRRGARHRREPRVRLQGRGRDR